MAIRLWKKDRANASGVTVRGRVSGAAVDPLLRDRRRRWLVSLDVVAVLRGDSEEMPPRILLLVHSPAHEFGYPDAVGVDFEVTLNDPIEEPYAGRFSVRRVRS